MTPAHLTAAVLVLNTASLIAYDIWARLRQPDGKATISWVLLTAAKHVPIIGVAAALGYRPKPPPPPAPPPIMHPPPKWFEPVADVGGPPKVLRT